MYAIEVSKRKENPLIFLKQNFLSQTHEHNIGRTRINCCRRIIAMHKYLGLGLQYNM